MTIAIGFTTRSPINEAVMDLRISFGTMTPKLVIFFASPRYDLDVLASSLREEIGVDAIIGCTSAGEIMSGRMQKGGVVGMALDEENVEDVCIAVVENLSAGPDGVDAAFKQFEEHFKVSMMDMDPQEYVGIVLSDGLAMCEEQLLERMGDKTNVTFVGGSAGDDLNFSRTFVFAGGKKYNNAAALALIKPTTKFGFIKTQSFKPLDKTLTATKVDVAKRLVLEFDNKPAAEAYAQLLGVSVAELPDHFMANPFGLMDGDEPYVRAPYKIQDNGLSFFCSIKEGTQLRLLEATDIIADTSKAVDEKIQEIGSVGGIINFHCILRTMELESKGLLQEYADIFDKVPTIGFSTYGEAIIGHVNQTSTMLVFEAPKRKSFLDDL